jgi:hypothetical protein
MFCRFAGFVLRRGAFLTDCLWEARNLAGVTSFFATRLWNVIDNNRRLCSGALKGDVFGILRDAVQVADPAGTATVSPSFREVTADLTSPNEALFTVNRSRLDLTEVTQERANRNKSPALTDFEYK